MTTSYPGDIPLDDYAVRILPNASWSSHHARLLTRLSSTEKRREGSPELTHCRVVPRVASVWHIFGHVFLGDLVLASSGPTCRAV